MVSKSIPSHQLEQRKKEKEKLLLKLSATNDDDDVIQRSVGIFGKWHVWVCFIIFLVKFPVAWHQLNIVIIAPVTPFECSDNEDKCATNCSSHVFDRSLFTETIITEWDLVCDRAYIANMAQTATMAGILVGSVVFGVWSDKSGRRYPMIFAVIIQLITATLQAFVPWLSLFIALRFLTAIGTGGTMTTSFVLIMEIVGTKWRTTAATVYQIPTNVGHLMLAILGYYIRDWRTLQLAISLPSIVLISYYWILPESPRWLLTVGRKAKAIKIMQQAAYYNNLPTEEIEEDVRIYLENKTDEPVSGGNILDLVKTKEMSIRTVCICANWFVCGFCFFGVSQYIGQLGGNLFFNVATSAIVQIPATFVSLISMEKLGRKKTLVLFQIVAGLPCLAMAWLSEESWFNPILADIAVFGISTSFPTVYIYSGELFPTVVRNIGVGSSSMCARVGSGIAPYVSTLGLFTASWLPPVIFGSVPLLGAFLCIWLPETLNCKLPDTVAEVESFGEVVERINIENFRRDGRALSIY